MKSNIDTTKVLVQPSMFRGIAEKVLTPEAERKRTQAKRNRDARIRRAKEAHR